MYLLNVGMYMYIHVHKHTYMHVLWYGIIKANATVKPHVFLHFHKVDFEGLKVI
jgi:hypothetical protein